MGKKYYLYDPKDFDLIKKYFNASGEIKKTFNASGEILDEIFVLTMDNDYETYLKDINVYYNTYYGRTLVLIETDLEYHNLILFSPFNKIEIIHIDISLDFVMIKRIYEDVVGKNLTFRQNIIENLYNNMKSFNGSLKSYLNIDFNFFLDYGSIVELNPFCKCYRDFNHFIALITEMIDTFNKKEIEKIVDPLSKDKIKGSIDAINELFQMIKKSDEIENDIKRLRIIRRLRNIHPIHNTDKYLKEFLKEFNKNYPIMEEDWCDLAIIILQNMTEIFNRFSLLLR